MSGYRFHDFQDEHMLISERKVMTKNREFLLNDFG
jgi:hypothetical protein